MFGLANIRASYIKIVRYVSLYTLIAALAALGKGLSVVNARPDIDQIQSLLEPSDED